ncbi:hypothetical protein DSO57_1002134 [Entomophthora muscae]|uniref:Uncharacterized protein n=1 Tax=Entomophthora muscae TaxID=34485 RepID=A0ACC2TW39_9FUNG|nr:hypothetical protein DSO57_1002134 [Entomophthora muscae]
MHTEHLYFAGVYCIITNFILLVLSNREYLQYQRQRWETEQLLTTSNQPPPAFTPSPRVLDQETIPASTPLPSFPAVPLLQQLAQPSLTMSAATGELPLIPSSSSYDYSKLGFAYLTMLGLTEQVIPHMGVWRPWATAANYVMQIAPVIYWAFQAQPFPGPKIPLGVTQAMTPSILSLRLSTTPKQGAMLPSARIYLWLQVEISSIPMASRKCTDTILAYAPLSKMTLVGTSSNVPSTLGALYSINMTS